MIKKGDVVQLKSGGPKMTIKYFTTAKMWVCTWFVEDEMKEGAFTEEQLNILN